MEHLLTADSLISLLTLTLMEIVLGIDNVIFISIVSAKLPAEEQKKARGLGIFMALFIRVLLLLVIKWIIGLTQPVFTIPDFGIELNEEQRGISWRDIILFAGGLFLLAKSTLEIHHKITEPDDHDPDMPKNRRNFMSVVWQIMLLDIVFSFDSIITAVGLADHVEIMIIAVLISMVIMFVFAGPISRFINKHPTMKMLALSFLLMIGLTLVAEAFAFHVPKGYVYFAMAFSLFVEAMNMRLRKKTEA